MIPDYGLRPLSGLRVECSCVNFNVEFGERSRITACGLYPGYGWNVSAFYQCSPDEVQRNPGKRINNKREPADKPGSVVDSHSSGHCVAAGLKQPTRGPCGQHVCPPIWSCSGWGLPCHTCYQVRGALLPHHFTLTGPAETGSAVYFLWHFPWTRALQALPGTLPCGARTFLPACAARLSGRLPG